MWGRVVPPTLLIRQGQGRCDHHQQGAPDLGGPRIVRHAAVALLMGWIDNEGTDTPPLCRCDAESLFDVYGWKVRPSPRMGAGRARRTTHRHLENPST